jgi:hypothetical protein
MEENSFDVEKELEILEYESLDNLIETATKTNFEKIIKLISELPSETEKDIYKNRLSKKLGVSPSSIKKDMKQQYENTDTETDDNKVLSANFSGLVELALDKKGNIAYIVNVQDKLTVKSAWEIDGTVYYPPEKDKIPFKLPRADAVLEFYETDSDTHLFNDLINYLKRFSYLKAEQRLIIAIAIFLSYIQDHHDIHYMPVILLFAVPERGKSRTGKAITYVVYRGIHLVELREANLFRYSQDMKATLFFDIMNLWKKAERSGAEDILLLRYEKGAKVARVLYPDKGSFKDMMHYDIFGSTFMATNQPVHKILDTRCISITMPNKPAVYENPTAEKAQPLRERLTAWRARIMDKPLPAVETVEGLNGRLWDISMPLIQICKLVASDKEKTLTDALLSISGQRLEDKKESTEGQIVQHLNDLSPEEENIFDWQIKTSELLEKLNVNRQPEYRLTPQGLGKKLKAMGINTRKVQGYSEILLNRRDFNTLLVEFGIIDFLPTAETLPNATTLRKNEKSTSCAGREVVESEGTASNSLPDKNPEYQGVTHLLESGGELSGDKEEIIIEGEL